MTTLCCYSWGQFFRKVEPRHLRVHLDATPKLQTGNAERFVNIALDLDADENAVNGTPTMALRSPPFVSLFDDIALNKQSVCFHGLIILTFESEVNAKIKK